MLVKCTIARQFLVKAALFIGVSSLLLPSTHAIPIHANAKYIEIGHPSNYNYIKAPIYVVGIIGGLIFVLLLALILVMIGWIVHCRKAKKVVASKQIKRPLVPLKMMGASEYFAVPGDQNKAARAKDAQIKELKREVKRDDAQTRDAQAKDAQLQEMQNEDAQANDMDANNQESDKETQKDSFCQPRQVILQMEKP
ncbi:hypothetical protein M3Y97_00151500 [Aphelenchoides bicaudatus]|nr:hypothetical protein M3Y97_00151500 [Aphelenchoides bicaudatus]